MENETVNKKTSCLVKGEGRYIDSLIYQAEGDFCLLHLIKTKQNYCIAMFKKGESDISKKAEKILTLPMFKKVQLNLAFAIRESKSEVCVFPANCDDSEDLASAVALSLKHVGLLEDSSVIYINQSEYHVIAKRVGDLVSKGGVQYNFICFKEEENDSSCAK